MSARSGERLIANVAELLVGNRVETEAICTSLAWICTYFSFDGGMVYEVDFSDHFQLAERFLACEVPLCEHFAVAKLRPEHRNRLSRETVCFADRQTEDGPGAALLSIFSAAALAVAPVTDENLRVCALIVLFNANTDQLPSDAGQKDLTVLLSLLARYTGVRLYQKKLSQAQISLESILDNTGIDIYVNDFQSHEILYVNKSMAAPYGGREQFVGRKCWQVLFPGQGGPCSFCPQKKIIDEQGEPSRVYTWDYQRPFDGAWFRVFSSAFRWMDGRLAHVVSSADITDNKLKEATIEYMAHYDALTNLPNRRMLVRECERRINLATEMEQGYLMFFDIDGFKAINDTYGHDAGDEFLVLLSAFFSGIPLLKDAIYRNGGDEFVAVIGGESVTKDNIRNLARFIHTRFQKPWALKKGEVFCNTSIGVACYPEDGYTSELLLQKADQAMYHVKKAGGGGICFGYQLP